MPTIVTMPKWGLTMTSGTVTAWSRQEGDPISEGAPLLTVETEKAVDDVEAPASGVLRKIGHNGVVVYSSARPTSVYFSYPGANYQVEVYTHSTRTARSLVEAGTITRITG